MIHKLEHVGVMVKDMDVSIRFYTEVFGLQLAGRVRLDDETELGFLSFPETDNVQVELISKGHDGLPERGKVDHIAFKVSDIEGETERLKRLGVKLIDEAPHAILDGVKILFFYGPDGERLEFYQPKA